MARAIKKFTDEEYRDFLDKCKIEEDLPREEAKKLIEECMEEATAFLDESVVVKLNEAGRFVIKDWAKKMDDVDVKILVAESRTVITDLDMFKRTLRRI